MIIVIVLILAILGSSEAKPTEQDEFCEPVEIDFCRDLYPMTYFPNDLLNLTTQRDASIAAYSYFTLIEVACHKEFRAFICGMHAPPCSETGEMIKPCESMCQTVRDGCEPLMDKYGITWPETLNCSMLPDANEKFGEECYHGPEDFETFTTPQLKEKSVAVKTEPASTDYLFDYSDYSDHTVNIGDADKMNQDDYVHNQLEKSLRTKPVNERDNVGSSTMQKEALMVESDQRPSTNRLTSIKPDKSEVAADFVTKSTIEFEATKKKLTLPTALTLSKIKSNKHKTGEDFDLITTSADAKSRKSTEENLLQLSFQTDLQAFSPDLLFSYTPKETVESSQTVIAHSTTNEPLNIQPTSTNDHYFESKQLTLFHFVTDESTLNKAMQQSSGTAEVKDNTFVTANFSSETSRISAISKNDGENSEVTTPLSYEYTKMNSSFDFKVTDLYNTDNQKDNIMNTSNNFEQFTQEITTQDSKKLAEKINTESTANKVGSTMKTHFARPTPNTQPYDGLQSSFYSTTKLPSSFNNEFVINIVGKPIESCRRDLKQRRYDIIDVGLAHYFKGWVDVQAQGAANDYCRVTQVEEKKQLACALAGTAGQSEYNYVARSDMRLGFHDTWFMRDVNGDGRDDYCRCLYVQSTNTPQIVCTLSGKNGFYGSAEQGGDDENFLYGESLGGQERQCYNERVNPALGVEYKRTAMNWLKEQLNRANSGLDSDIFVG